MGERLNSWKAIASYLGREVRTAQRWEKVRELPVHRLPGGARPRVYALKTEIDAWLRSPAPEPQPRSASIAVLPFLDLGGSAGDSFGVGLADDLIDQLVRVPGLQVIARTSSFALGPSAGDVREIGARLGAAWLVEGSIRRDDRRVRVTAQLVNARTGLHAWSERYDRQLTDIFAIQDEIARAIARALRVTLTHDRAGQALPDLVAYDLWVKGRALSQQFMPDALAQARECFEAAIARDPLFARPHFGLASLLFQAAHFGVLDLAAVARAREAITRSLELDPHFGEAHALLGTIRGLLDNDWPGAEAAFRRALELSPGSATVLSAHAWHYLAPTLQLRAAVEEAKLAVAMDPLSPMAHGYLSLVLLVARQYPEACEASRMALELAPGFWWLRWFYGSALVFRGDVEEGLRQCWRVYEQARQPLVVGALTAVCGLCGRREQAEALFRELEGMAAHREVTPQAYALAYLGLGDDRVFEWLDRAISARDPMVTHLPSMPLYDGLRGDPRFTKLLARMGLGGLSPVT